MKEEWKDIKGYEGLYKVSNKGRIMSLNYHLTGKSKILNLSKIKRWSVFKNDYEYYFRVTLSKKCITNNYLVHQLECIAFKPNPENKPTVNHINHITTDNRLENLEWATHKEQRDKLWYLHNSNAVLQYDLDGNFIREWPSTREAARELNISHSQINRCARGIIKNPRKYIWRYKQ